MNNSSKREAGIDRCNECEGIECASSWVMYEEWETCHCSDDEEYE